MPPRGPGASGETGWSGNPFYSQKTQREIALRATRPADLPMDGDSENDPLQDSFGMHSQPHQSSMLPTGKGRGSQAPDGMLSSMPSVVKGHGEMRTEGRLPDENVGDQTMGPVKDASMGSGQEKKVDDLQRALESELVGYLRDENSKLMNELAVLKGKMQSMSAVPAETGFESSPWSAIGVTSDESSKGTMGISQPPRPGRQGSRTPRSKVREHALSPENGVRKNHAKFTPNGTKVPDGPPPSVEVPIYPPVPPLPVVDERTASGRHQFCQQPQHVRHL